MSYEELLKAYETLTEKCSKLEKEIEDKNLKIEILTEHLAKKNKMIFGQKSEKNKYIADGQLRNCEKISFQFMLRMICSAWCLISQ